MSSTSWPTVGGSLGGRPASDLRPAESVLAAFSFTPTGTWRQMGQRTSYCENVMQHATWKWWPHPGRGTRGSASPESRHTEQTSQSSVGCISHGCVLFCLRSQIQ